MKLIYHIKGNSTKLNYKYIVLLFLVNSTFIDGYAQVKKAQNLPGYDYKILHFGFTVGVNTMDFAFHRSKNPEVFADISKVVPGFQVMIVSELRLSEYWSFRFLPGINFGQRLISYYYPDSNDKMVLDRSMRIGSDYIDFPMLLKYKSERINNFRPYLICGITPRLDLAARKDFDRGSNIYLRLKTFDVANEFGIGIDSFLQYFKFSTELKISVGMRDILVHVPDDVVGHAKYVNSIDRLNAYVVMLCFHFE